MQLNLSESERRGNPTRVACEPAQMLHDLPTVPSMAGCFVFDGCFGQGIVGMRKQRLQRSFAARKHIGEFRPRNV